MNLVGRKIFNAAKRDRWSLLSEYLDQKWAFEHWELLANDTNAIYLILSEPRGKSLRKSGSN